MKTRSWKLNFLSIWKLFTVVFNTINTLISIINLPCERTAACTLMEENICLWFTSVTTMHCSEFGKFTDSRKQQKNSFSLNFIGDAWESGEDWKFRDTMKNKRKFKENIVKFFETKFKPCTEWHNLWRNLNLNNVNFKRSTNCSTFFWFHPNGTWKIVLPWYIWAYWGNPASRSHFMASAAWISVNEDKNIN